MKVSDFIWATRYVYLKLKVYFIPKKTSRNRKAKKPNVRKQSLSNNYWNLIKDRCQLDDILESTDSFNVDHFEQEIKYWEQETIKTVKKIVQTTLDDLHKIIGEQKKCYRIKLNQISQDLLEYSTRNDISDRNFDHLKTELDELKLDVKNLVSNISLDLKWPAKIDWKTMLSITQLGNKKKLPLQRQQSPDILKDLKDTKCLICNKKTSYSNKVCNECLKLNRIEFFRHISNTLKLQARKGFDELKQECEKMKLLIDIHRLIFKPIEFFDQITYGEDKIAEYYLQTYCDSTLENYIPVDVRADGNCFYNSFLSISSSCDFDVVELRTRNIIELVNNSSLYQRQYANILHLLDPLEQYVTNEMVKNHQDSTVWDLLSITAVLGIQVKSIYPKVNGKNDELAKYLNQTFSAINRYEQYQTQITLLWSHCSTPKQLNKPWMPNHFVPLLKNITVTKKLTNNLNVTNAVYTDKQELTDVVYTDEQELNFQNVIDDREMFSVSTDDNFAMGASAIELLVYERGKLRLITLTDGKVVDKSLAWKHGDIKEICWSAGLQLFLVLTWKYVFTFNPTDKQIQRIQEIQGFNYQIFGRCCCFGQTLFLCYNHAGSPIEKWYFTSNWEMAHRWLSPLSCKSNEVIKSLGVNATYLAVLKTQSTFSVQNHFTFDLYDSAMMIINTIQLSTESIWHSIVSLNNDQWLINIQDIFIINTSSEHDHSISKRIPCKQGTLNVCLLGRKHFVIRALNGTSSAKLWFYEQ
ncbi:unnamed protein product [Didymodactylos carnosus]|uniref:OTU domain-containing protein n=1 Tax=Didymodactylos carnosus TaxID=1234261 RepID=A0A813NH80_9BILA|nr:unnamed protein product [Didymodactylos carnosus]CAF0944099.1 unnamed protein product [Didymodactylos carnosus]CAF3515441.1 unnamed protein product [Didymodactylos carnosus]CAF3718837.1 unnamed protein product [Didymodactylos carnosus]